jgi:hypothetical protein
MELKRKIRFVVTIYAVFAYLWIEASVTLRDISLTLTHNEEISFLILLGALVQAIRMLLESFAAQSMTTRPPNEQAAYLELIYKRIS